ncbi:MAG: hypothetical protein E6Q36_09360 [Chryseobacterium sp.]|nr:MAG: hypothetical protein E6Q36_09360 [Chryseobacterium sp.]
MKKISTPTKILIAVIILVIIIVVIRKKRAKQAEETTIKTPNKAITGITTKPALICENTTPLKKGSKCDRVEWAQYEINKVASKIGIAKLAQDGIFGTKTEAAFKKLLGKTSASYAEVRNKVAEINS